jgi:transcriptional regulator with XRE-family HTH domain
MEEFGRRLRYYRKRRRFTQSQLAAEVGVAAAYVSQIESSLRMPSLKVARRFAASLGLELPTLLGNEEASPSTDQLSDSEKLEVLRRLIRAVEFDQDNRPNRVDLECYGGRWGVLISQDDETAVRAYAFSDTTDGETPDLFHRHPGEETVYCAVGQADVIVGGHRSTLRAGDTLTFDSSAPHTILAASGGVVVSTVNPPLAPETYEQARSGAGNGAEAGPVIEPTRARGLS